MLKELKTSKLMEMRKIAKVLYEDLDSALSYRATLLSDTSTLSRLEVAKHERLRDPESYYHFKLFDKAVSIVRLYNKQSWISHENNNFHFSVRCHGFTPSIVDMNKRISNSYIDCGDFDSIENCFPYFTSCIIQLLSTEYDFDLNLFDMELVRV